MASASAWLRSAESCFSSAARLASETSWRSACNRAYYAAHNGAHAVLAHMDATVASAQRSVPHGELPAKLYRMVRADLFLGELGADLLRRRLIDAYNIRVEADYKPEVTIDSTKFGVVRSPARQIVEFARRLING